MKFKFTCLIIFSILLQISAIASDDNWFHCQKSIQNNGYIVSGGHFINGNTLSTIAYSKVDLIGNVIWQKALIDNNELVVPYSLNKGQNNYFTCGLSYDNGFGSPGDAYVLAFDENGNKLWDWLGGETNTDVLNGICEKNNGEIISVGTSNSFSSFDDLVVLKFDQVGNLLTSKRVFNQSNNIEKGLKVKHTADGGYIIMGIIKTSSQNDLLLIKYSVNDNINWAKQYSIGTFYDPIDIIESLNGDFVIVGGNQTSNISGNNLLKVNSNGNIIWFNTYYSNVLERPSNLCEQNNNIYVNGMVQVAGSNSTLDAQFFSTNNNGDLLYANKISVNGLDGKRIGYSERDAINQNEYTMFTGGFSGSPRQFDVGVQKVSLHSGSCNNIEHPLNEGTLNIAENTLNLNEASISFFEFNGFNSGNINEFTSNYCEQEVFPYFEVSSNCNQSIQLNNLSTNGVSYNWDFGDANNSSQSNPTHTYSSPGTYTITLTAADANGNTDWWSEQVTINPLPNVSIVGLPASASSTNPISLNATPAGGTFSGTGVIFNAFNPSIAGVGIHNITYTYTDQNGCTNTDEASILVFNVSYNFVNYNLGTISP